MDEPSQLTDEAKKLISASDDYNHTDWEKQQIKTGRQQLKLRCLELAINQTLTAQEIVRSAKLYYQFVRG